MTSHSGKMLVKAGVIIAIIIMLIIICVVGGKSLLGMLFEKALGINMKPSVGKVESQYDPTPAPLDIDRLVLVGDIITLKDSLFFLSQSHMNGKVDVDFDSFVLPNGSYAHPDISWSKVVSKSGANILRPPTEKEKKNDAAFSSNIHLYITDKNSEPDFAEGTVHLRVPCQFAHVTFLASEVDRKRMAGRLTVTLAHCENDQVTLKLRGIDKSEDAIIVLRDVTGGRLQEGSSEREFGSNSTASLKAQGTIAKIEVFYPTAFAESTFFALATTQPDTFGVATPEVKYARYVKSGLPRKATIMDETAFKAQTSIKAARDNALMGFNDPELTVKLPDNLNSAFSLVDFGAPVLHGAHGETVTYTAQNGMFDGNSSSIDFRFTDKDANKTVEFAHATGTVHLRHPLNLQEISLTATSPRNGALQVQFNGAVVSIAGLDSKLKEASDVLLPDDLMLVRAYDATGRQLKSFGNIGSGELNGVASFSYAFWGKPVEVRVFSVGKWLTLDLPFDLPPAPKLTTG